MKTAKLLMLTLTMSVLMVGKTNAAIFTGFFTNWLITTNINDCGNGQGICLIVSTATDKLSGELNIQPKTLQGYFTCHSKTEGASAYVKGNKFILPVNSYINPAVLKSETGIDGLYMIRQGTYKCELLSTGFYKVWISLSK